MITRAIGRSCSIPPNRKFHMYYTTITYYRLNTAWYTCCIIILLIQYIHTLRSSIYWIPTYDITNIHIFSILIYSGWTRVLYSCEVKLFPLIPEFIINYLTKTALIESTTWVRKESEKTMKKIGSPATGSNLSPSSPTTTVSENILKECFIKEADGSSRYITNCAENLASTTPTAPTAADSTPTDSTTTATEVEGGVEVEAVVATEEL